MTLLHVQETKKTSAKYGEPTTGSLWIAFDRHVSEAGEVGLLHAEFSRKLMADVHDGLLEFYNQEEYLAVHRKRFFELDNIVANLVRDVPRARVLDVGISINSIILSKLLPSAEIAICDRFELKGQPFDFFDVDLTDPDLDRKTLHQEFDVIIFTEVLEHLLANPVRVFNFFLRHLRPDGHLIVTTPNFFSAANSRALALGENPQPIFSARLKRGQEVEHHVREYSMSELLLFAEEAGGAPAAFFFSSCWDSPSEDTPPENRGNLCAVFKCDV